MRHIALGQTPLITFPETRSPLVTSATAPQPSLLAPLRVPVFRRIWSASLLTYFGQMIQAVGASWAMTELTDRADMIALVQTATMAPMMFIALVAGAIADTYDRRKVALIGLGISLVAACCLTAFSWLDMLTPWLILGATFTIGSGLAFFAPSWQASVNEQVPPADISAAVSLNGISYNIARSFGPAIGGVLVAISGAALAFSVNALFFLPMIVVMFLWQRVHEPPRLPPETLGRAIVSGSRFIFHSPSIRVVIIRTIITATIGCALSALMPLIARDLLNSGATIYGLILGALGMGAVSGALLVPKLNARLSSEAISRLSALLVGAGMAITSFSPYLPLTAAAIYMAGIGWMIIVTTYNVNVQTVAPRWVAGRVLAAFQTSMAGGIAIGSWIWGHIAHDLGVDSALLIAALVMLASAGVGLWLKLPLTAEMATDSQRVLADPEVELAINARSGPIVIELEYRVPRHRARAFYGVMQQVQLSRQRNGAYGWSIARDMHDPELWIERYHCPTWLDFLRQRNRPTQAERELQDAAFEFHVGENPPVVRRMLERPFGSVRWRDDVRDAAIRTVQPVGPGS